MSPLLAWRKSGTPSKLNEADATIYTVTRAVTAHVEEHVVIAFKTSGGPGLIEIGHRRRASGEPNGR